MLENSRPENDSYNELEPIESLLSDLSGADDFESDFFQGLNGRRRKAAFALTIIWGGTIALHLVSWGSWLVLCLTSLLGIQVLRTLLARPLPLPEPLSEATKSAWPSVSLLVAAKNEEAVIGKLVRDLCNQDYPNDRYEVLVIDDNSTDQTPMLLEQVAREYSHLKVLRRVVGAGGGKSGALNQVLPLTKGEILAVFDADAQVTPDLLRRTLPLFAREKVGAVQVRKAIANPSQNFWTKGQRMEMALDSYIQQQRIAIGGIGELRGNGQFVRRTAIERCGGWNEQTITDDLDLTIRLHLDQWDIAFLIQPAVEEEGVTSALALWHQRSRWAEGGYQRYLDYWRYIVRNRLGYGKTIDMFGFWLLQYILPAATVPDFLMAIILKRPPMLSPATSLGFTFSMVGMFMGLRRIEKRSFFSTILSTLHGTLYMLHWLLVLASTTARISVQPKRLRWVKTVHQGTNDEGFEF